MSNHEFFASAGKFIAWVFLDKGGFIHVYSLPTVLYHEWILLCIFRAITRSNYYHEYNTYLTLQFNRSRHAIDITLQHSTKFSMSEQALRTCNNIAWLKKTVVNKFSAKALYSEGPSYVHSDCWLVCGHRWFYFFCLNVACREGQYLVSVLKSSRGKPFTRPYATLVWRVSRGGYFF